MSTPSPSVAQVYARAHVQPRCADLTERIAAAIEGTDPEAGRTHHDLARIAYGVEDPSDTQLAAVRRSVARLVRDGRAERGRSRFGWVEVHRPLTPSEREAKGRADDMFVRAFQDRRDARRRATPYPIDTGYGGIVEVPVEPVFVIREGGVELREGAAS